MFGACCLNGVSDGDSWMDSIPFGDGEWWRGNVVYVDRNTYHLQTCCVSSDSPSVSSSFTVVSRMDEVEVSKSCCTADARKSSLLVPM
jgi:hypothetical protein